MLVRLCIHFRGIVFFIEESLLRSPYRVEMLKSRIDSYLLVIYVKIYKYTVRNLTFNSPAPTNVDSKVISRRSTEKLSIKSLVIKLQGLLGIKSYLALEIVKQNRKFTKVAERVIDNNFNLCKSQNISNDILLKYPAILYDVEIEHKLTVLKSLNQDYNEIAPLLLLSTNVFDSLLHKNSLVGLEKRIQFFCKEFNIEPIGAYEALVTKPFLRYIAFNKVITNAQLLLGRGITTEEIVRDFWVLRYSTNIIKGRFDEAETERVEKLKTWMVRGKRDIFEAHIKRKTENKLILGNNSLAEYVRQRLDCSFGEAASIIERIPAIRNKNMRKLREIFNFLYGEGFTAQHIIRLPKILLHSVATSRKRLRELDSVPGGHKLDSVHILTKSRRQYMQYYEATKEKANKLAMSAKVEN